MNLDCFKAYDIRGKVPSMLNEDIAREIGFAFAKELSAQFVVIGYDARLTCPELYRGLADGLQKAGCDVVGIGMCGTEEIYHATGFANLDGRSFDGGIMITGSHNPADENGMKMVRRGAVPISGDSGLKEIKARIQKGQIIPTEQTGSFVEHNFREEYVQTLLSSIDVEALKPFKIVADIGNGCAGLAIKALMPSLPFEFVLLGEEPDGHFPNGVPNPILPENRRMAAEAVQKHGADFGIAFDGDFDRCFFYDAQGNFIEGYYIVGMIAEAMLEQQKGASIIHDPRLVWNTQDLVEKAHGKAIECKTGHAFIKERMRKEDAIYGGEMSAHHYFKDFAYCDSGMLPWLFVAQLLSRKNISLAECVADRINMFPCSGEINRKVASSSAVLEAINIQFAPQAYSISHTDGLAMDFATWRFNVRSSNTEPVMRLNVESRGDKILLKEKTEELLKLMGGE